MNKLAVQPTTTRQRMASREIAEFTGKAENNNHGGSAAKWSPPLVIPKPREVAS